MRIRHVTAPRTTLAILAAAAVVMGLLTVPAGAAPADPATSGPAIDALQTQGRLTPMGSGSLREIAASHAGEQAEVLTNGPEIPGPKRPNAAPDPRVTPALTPNPGITPVAGREKGMLAFNGLNHVDSRYASNGNQYSGEPPDQALCVGNGFTFEMVNQVVTVYNGDGSQLVPDASINEFYGLAPNITRTAPPTFGPFVFDPVCLYDAQLQRWFVINTGLDADPFTGAFTGGSRLYLAVSATDDPTGTFGYYSLDTTDGDENDTGCPCFDDFPHIGADANGFFISTNRFSVLGPEFNGAKIHAFSKQGLAAAADGTGPVPPVVSINAGYVNGNPSFTVQPATVPPGGQFLDREYFLSSLNFDTNSEESIAIWALDNTETLDTEEPDLRLTRRVISSLEYAFAPDVRQRPGPAPLAESLGERLNKLDNGAGGNMQEITFADGRLWATIGTAVGASGEPKRSGVLWLQVQPTFRFGQVGGQVVEQGYVTVNNNSLLYPTVGVNADGVGAIVMSLAGPTVFPSASFIAIDSSGVSGPVRVPGVGAGPEDGFTCYLAFGDRSRGCRWGDYTEAVADENGDIWMTTEYIPNGPRTELANWGTYVMKVNR
ncbi:MAG: hypothetical protein ACR2JK_15320 [Geodermatophilaceae bacterium]